MGHDLKLYTPIAVGDIDYRDDYETDLDYKCKLRVSFDFTVSTGYAHLFGEVIAPDEEVIDSQDANNYPN